MAESVYRVTEVVGVSSDSWEQAATNAVEVVGASVRDLRIAEVIRQDVTIEDGKISASGSASGLVQVREGVDRTGIGAAAHRGDGPRFSRVPSFQGHDAAMAQAQPAGATAPANEEAVRAWDTVLYERWKQNRKVFVGALAEVTEEVFERFPPPEGGSCLDIGCGSAIRPAQMAELVGPEGFALGTDSSPRFIADARREAAEAGIDNVEFETADTQTADWDPDLRLRLLTDGHPVLRRTGAGDARDPRRARARRRASQDLLAPQGREPVLGGDGAGRRAVSLAP